MSEEPHLRAYLCDECWKAIPHFRVAKQPQKKITKKKGISIKTLTLYIIADVLCLGAIAYYLWFN